MKPLGSELFGTSEIRTDEYVLLAQSIRGGNPGIDIETVALDIEFIDDCLTMRKSVAIWQVADYGLRTCQVSLPLMRERMME